MEIASEILTTAAGAAILFFDAAGVLIMIALGVMAIVDLVRRSPELRQRLGRGMGTALQFLMGGEILRTVVTHELEDIAVIGALVLIRAAMAIMLYWETGREERMLQEKDSPCRKEVKGSVSESGPLPEREIAAR